MDLMQIAQPSEKHGNVCHLDPRPFLLYVQPQLLVFAAGTAAQHCLRQIDQVGASAH